MGLSFKVAPGVRVRASSHGLSAGIGPRAARVHVGSRGVGVSSGIGPFSSYTSLSGGRRSGSGGARRTSGPTKASLAAKERELRAAQREADIEKVAWLEKSLVEVHRESFEPARRVKLPPPEPVDPTPIRNKLEAEAGISALVAELGGGDSPAKAADPEPIDRYALLREARRQARQGISLFAIRERIEAARRADQEAEAKAEAEAEQRSRAREQEQQRLDDLWTKLEKARAVVEEMLPGEIAAEEAQNRAKRTEEQTALDDEWTELEANEPQLTMATLEAAFADNESPAAPINCEGDRTTVVMQFSQPDAVVPERKPARTPTGKRTLKKRTKTEINALYLDALGSNALATVKEAFAVAPGTQVVQLLVIRREVDKRHAGELSAIYAAEFDRATYWNGGGSRSPAATVQSAPEALLNLKGKTQQVSPIDLAEQPDLKEVLVHVADGLRG